MKKAVSIFLVLFAVLLPLTVSAAGTEPMRIEEYGISLDFPAGGDGWMFFGRDLKEDDPNLPVVGADAKTILDSFAKSGIYLNTVKEDLSGEYSLACEKTDKSEALHNYNLMDDETFKEQLENVLKSDFKKNLKGLKYQKYEILRGEPASFSIMDGTITSSSEENAAPSVYFTQYNTVVNGVSVNITYHSYNGEVPAEAREMLGRIAASMKWDELTERNIKKSGVGGKMIVGIIILVVLTLLLIPNIRHYRKREAEKAAERAAKAEAFKKAVPLEEAPGAQASDTKSPDAQVSDNQAPDAQASDNQASDAQVSCEKEEDNAE